MAASIQLPKAERGEEYDIDCFSRTEREMIIEAFEESKHYRYYAPLVKTLFFTGMKPSEAIATRNFFSTPMIMIHPPLPTENLTTVVGKDVLRQSLG